MTSKQKLKGIISIIKIKDLTEELAKDAIKYLIHDFRLGRLQFFASTIQDMLPLHKTNDFYQTFIFGSTSKGYEYWQRINDTRVCPQYMKLIEQSYGDIPF